METNMKTLKALLEDVRAFNLDTDEELDLDALADMDLDSLLGGDFIDPDSGTEELNFDLSDLENMALDDEPLEFEDPDLEASDLGADAVDGTDLGSLDGESEGDYDLEIGDTILDDDEAEEDFDDMSQNQADDIATGGEEGDPDFQGEIRTVRGANLVFKRKMDDGNFEELWIYNVGNDIKRETQIRRAILAGTDVDPGAQESKDGSQRADTSTTGNVQFLHIVGLPQ